MENKLLQRFSWFSSACGVFGLLIAVAVLIGGLFDIEELRLLISPYASMKFNTAAGLLFCSVSLILSQLKNRNKVVKSVSQLCGIFVFLIGSLTLSQDLFSWDLGIDQLVIIDSDFFYGTSHPGRMSIFTALCFIFFGLAIVISFRQRGNGFFVFLVSITIVVACLSLLQRFPLRTF